MRIHREVDLPGFFAHVAAVQACGDHPLPTLTPDVLASVEEVIDAYIEEAERYEDTASSIIVRLADKRFGLFHEWSDSSGHG